MKNLVKNSHKKTLVMMADVRSSRLIKDRTLLQTGLREVTKRVNDEKSSLVEIPFSISGGDEIQGLLAKPEAMVEIIDCLDLNSSHFEFRFGVGWGTVATPWESRTWEMDGECFHHARDAINRGKKEDRWVTAAGFGDEGDQILNGIFRAMQVMREGWTKKQRLAIATRKANPTQTAAAEEMGLDNSTLSKTLKAASYKQTIELEAAMPVLIRRLLEATE